MDEALSPQTAAVATHDAVVVAAALAVAVFISLAAPFIAAASSLACVCIFFLAVCSPAASSISSGSWRRDRVRAPGVLSPRPTGDLPVHDGRRHLAGAHLRRRSPLALRLCAWWLLLLARAHSYNHDTACLCALVFGSQLQELQGRLKKAILEYVVLAGSPLSPYPRQPAREVRCVLHAELHVWRRGSGSSPGRAESPPEGGSTSTRSGHRHPAGAPRRRSPLARRASWSCACGCC